MWIKKNPGRYRENRRKRQKSRYKNDINFKMRMLLSGRLYNAIKNKNKTGSAVRDLGCSIDGAKKCIEKQFYPHPKTNMMMTWENWGKGASKWQVDHRKEFRDYDLTDRKQLLEVVHYTNLQPLWHVDHVKKTRRSN